MHTFNSSIFGSSRRALAAACFAAAMTVFGGQAHALVYPTSNLLTNPGFENSALTPIINVLGSPYNTNIWGYEASTITTAVGGVTPVGPTHMLSMTNAGGIATQTVQSVDVTPYSTDISTGSVTASFNSQFDVDSSVPAAAAGVILQYYDASHNFVGSTSSASLLLDANPSTWQQISLNNISVPTNTTYVLAQVLYNNASLSTVNGALGAGFVDNAVLTLDRTNTPEPDSLALLIPTGAMLLLRRRRAA
jgi:hypothetical protein